MFCLGQEPAEYLQSVLPREVRGAWQQIELNQTEATPLVVRCWSKSENVRGTTDDHYSVWIEGVYRDGTPMNLQTGKFQTGTHDWHQCEFVIRRPKPIGLLNVYLMFRGHRGRVWFDDIFVDGENGRENLLANPGFEELEANGVRGWKPFPGRAGVDYVLDTEVTHSGQGSIRCEVSEFDGRSPTAGVLAGTFRDALGPEGMQIETNAPPTVFVRPVRKGDLLIFHLVNHDYDGATKTINRAGPFRLAVRLPKDNGASESRVVLASPDHPGGDIPLSYRSRNGWLEVQIPELRVWNILYIRLQSK